MNKCLIINNKKKLKINHDSMLITYNVFFFFVFDSFFSVSSLSISPPLSISYHVLLQRSWRNLNVGKNWSMPLIPRGSECHQLKEIISMGILKTRQPVRWVSLYIYIYIYIYIYNVLKSLLSYLLLMTVFFTNGIQALQHVWKKCVNCKWDYVEM